MITDSEAPTYNFNSDDEAPCEYLNDIYSISEDTFSFKIIKQLGEGYYSPGNGHKVKIIYYELGSEDKVTNVGVYLGKNDKLPYIVEIAVKCMKKNEVCIIQAPKLFTKIFNNSERKHKYDKKENFRTEFKKGLRFKQKCVEKYLSYSIATYLKRIKLSSNDIKLLVRKRKLKRDNPDRSINKEQKSSPNEELSGKDLHKCKETLTLEDINNVRYKLLKEDELSTYVVYLKEFNRVDVLNDDKTIIKEVIREGKGIVTPKKNDYIDFFIQDGEKNEYIHTTLEVHNLKYRGLFKILQSMKKKEMSKIVLKGLECLHIYNSTENIDTKDNKKTQEKYSDDIHKNQNNFCQDNNKGNIINIEAKTSRFETNHQIKKNKDNAKKENYVDIRVANKLFKQKREIIIELVDFKKSKVVNISSIMNINYKEKLLFYMSENDKNKNINKPIIDTDCELIIHLSIKYDMNKTKNKNIYLPIHFWDNNDNIKKRKAYFLFSYGSSFTTPLWFYECFKGLKEGEEVIIPLTKNENIFSENYFVHHLLFQPKDEREKTRNEKKGIQQTVLQPCTGGEMQSFQVYKQEVEYNVEKNSAINKEKICNKKKILKNAPKNDKNKIKKRKNSEVKIPKINNQYKFIQFLISNRNIGKGFFLINDLKKDEVDRFCESFFSLQRSFIDNVSDKNELRQLLLHGSSFQRIKKKKFCKKIVNIQKKNKVIKMKKQIDKYYNEGKPHHNCCVRQAREKSDDFSFFKNSLKSVYFDKSFYEKDAILKIKIVKLICKKKDPWNMNMSEQVEYLKIYNEMGNTFMKRNLHYAASLHYIKGFNIFRFSKIYNLIFEEKKLNLSNFGNDDTTKELIIYMEKILTNLAISLYKLSNYNECVKYAERAVTINPQNVKSIYWKHMAYLQQNKYHEIIQNLNNSFCLQNSTLLKLYNTARLIKKKQDTDFNSLFYAMYEQK
ncbi:hypothetical protein, conserved [Plasmodium gonderi]|uniref:Uncharacterized protein n=1 Tax=Plasmodium gonderi TaxID=77519 RepID=A0A1Y1JP88_PLAGO|nr:hypothetical protein, conserved [Plasmodium gonderi]GAW83245.1 hypothetical protein, conserved [Plasmodium gonderi]